MQRREIIYQKYTLAHQTIYKDKEQISQTDLLWDNMLTFQNVPSSFGLLFSFFSGCFVSFSGDFFFKHASTGVNLFFIKHMHSAECCKFLVLTYLKFIFLIPIARNFC